jgi:hypothetical protein
MLNKLRRMKTRGLMTSINTSLVTCDAHDGLD